MGAAGQQGVDGSSRYLLDQKTEQLQGRGVSPMQVFQDKEYRLLLCQLQKEGDNRFERFLTLTLW